MKENKIKKGKNNIETRIEILWFVAQCKKCEEYFRPVCDKDLTHQLTNDGKECDSQGQMLGYGGRVR